MKITKFITAILLAAVTLLPFTTKAAARIPVYRVDDALLFFDKASGEITGFAGEPEQLSVPAYIGGYKVNSIGTGAFADCRSLKKVAVAEGITSIGERAFYQCQALTEAVIPASVSSIGDSAFRACSALSDITFNGPVDRIEVNAFDGTLWRLSGDYVIAGQTLLLKYNGQDENPQIPYGVKTIAPKAFAYNTVIKSVTLPQGVTEIGDNAFVHCYSLESISFPDTLTTVGLGAFDDTIWLRSREEEFVCVNGILVAYNGQGGCVNVPPGVTSISSGAFMSNERITAVSLPEGLASIGEAAFADTNSLLTVVIPDSVVWIDDYAFAGSQNVTLFGSSGSYAEYYSKINSVTFSLPISVDVNSEGVYFDVWPVIIGSSAYVPMRAVMEKLGLSVYWNDARREVTVTDGEKTVVSQVGSSFVTVDGERLETEAAPVMMRDRVLLPVRFFAEIFGFDVSWNDENRSVEIKGN